MRLRDYQTEAIKAVISELQGNGDRLYLKCATGSGKTFMTKKIIELLRDSYPFLRFLFLVPKNILIEQTARAFGDVGIYNAEYGEKNLEKQITLASVQSLINEENMPFINILFIDEVHRASNQHHSLLSKLRLINPKIKVIGLTATDYNLDKRFELKKVYDCGLRELTDRGYLAPIVCGTGKGKLDITKLRRRGDEYYSKDIAEQLTDERVEEQIKDMLYRVGSRSWIIIMATTINHAEKINSMINGGHLYHSKLDKTERKHNLGEWKTNGGFLVSVIAASEGFDHPLADCLVMFRPTRSATLYEQAIGRIARLSPNKKDGLFLDYGGVIDSLGLPYDIHPLKKGEKTHKDCPECSAALPLSTVECDQCSYVFTNKCFKCGRQKRIDQTCCKSMRDYMANVKDSAFERRDQWKKITDVKLIGHTSRAGNRCLRVLFYNGIVLVHSEYFSFMNKDFTNFRDALFNNDKLGPLDLIGKEITLKPTAIFLRPSGGYKRVSAMRFY